MNGFLIKFYMEKPYRKPKSINGVMVDKAKRDVVSDSLSNIYLITEKLNF